MQYVTLQVMAHSLVVSVLNRMQIQILHHIAMLAVRIRFQAIPLIPTSLQDQSTSQYQSTKSSSFNLIAMGLLFGYSTTV